MDKRRPRYGGLAPEKEIRRHQGRRQAGVEREETGIGTGAQGEETQAVALAVSARTQLLARGTMSARQ